MELYTARVSHSSDDRRKQHKADDAARQRGSREAPPVAIRRVPKKIGEGDDNLKRRGEWFRKRTTPDTDA